MKVCSFEMLGLVLFTISNSELPMKAFLAFALTLLLAGCGTRLNASVEHFTEGFSVSPSNVYFVRAIPSVGDQTNLEERSYASALSAQLLKAGHSVTSNPSEATHNIFFGLSISNPKTNSSVVAAPVYGMVPSGTSFTSGYAAGNTFSATTTQMQTFGVRGYVPQTVTETTFMRVGTILIFPTTGPNTRQPVSQIRVRSEGSCGILSIVAPSMARAVVERLGKPGSETIQVPFEGRC
jgi:hypothetical protein